MSTRPVLNCVQISKYSSFRGKELKKCFCRKYATLTAIQPQPLHIPVMPEETMTGLNIQPSSTVIDMTFGSGGHSREILSRYKDCKVIALDRDKIAFQLAEEMALEFSGRLIPLLGKFSELGSLLKDLGCKQGSIDGILIDCGCSSMQFDTASRGFALSKDGPLDMRMDGERLPDQLTAADVVNHLSQEDLAQIIRKYGEENRANDIACGIVENRPITRTKQLAKVIGNSLSVFNHSTQLDAIGRRAHIATKTFMGLRIFVNDEFNELHSALNCAEKYLRHDGRLAVLTFHSLEDKVVRYFFRKRMYSDLSKILKTMERSKRKSLRSLNWTLEKQLSCCTIDEEIAVNPRARSATLRVITRSRHSSL